MNQPPVTKASKPPTSEGSFSVPACDQHLLPSNQLAGGNVPPPALFIHNEHADFTAIEPTAGKGIRSMTYEEDALLPAVENVTSFDFEPIEISFQDRPFIHFKRETARQRYKRLRHMLPAKNKVAGAM